MIKIVCVGKIKEKYLKDAITEYQKRISKYTKLNIIEVKDYDYDDILIFISKSSSIELMQSLTAIAICIDSDTLSLSRDEWM